MPNIIRNFTADGYYHVYNRGHGKMPVYREEFDYNYFLELIVSNAEKFGIIILAYCLMRNHYHFAVKQTPGIQCAVSKWIGNSTMSYGHYFNRKYSMVGAVFQGRFRSKLVHSDEYLYHLVNYIHLNPASFIDPHLYLWSSLQTYVTGRTTIADPTIIAEYLDGKQYILPAKEVALLLP